MRDNRCVAVNPRSLASALHLLPQRYRTTRVCRRTHRVLCSRKTPGQVADWARTKFEEEVGQDKEHINLAKLCMLVALEEEAAEALHAVHSAPNNGELYHRVFFPRDSISSGRDSWSHGAASTWSLKRLDSLAAEIQAAFQKRCALPLEDAPDRNHDSMTSPSATLQSPPQQGDACAAEQLGSATSQQSQAMLAAMRQFPVHSMSAVNRVLFEQHGYRRMQRHGDPRDAQLHRVLEQGTGCPAALAILYMEVCARLGLPLAARILDRGRYLVLWPQQQELQVGGRPLVIDPYSQGVPLLADEVCQLFELGADSEAGHLFHPATAHEILAALLGVLRDAHWCQAVGCRPEPALMTPISLATACRGDMGMLDLGYHLQRAIAAAERQALLLPESGEVYLQLVILLYSAGEYHAALKLLECSLDLLNQQDPDLLETFRGKLQLLVAEHRGDSGEA